MTEANETAVSPFATDEMLEYLELPENPTLATGRELLGRLPGESLEDAVKRIEVSDPAR